MIVYLFGNIFVILSASPFFATRSLWII